MSCYKCGRETPDGSNECAPACGVHDMGAIPPELLGAIREMTEQLRKQQAIVYDYVDWGKVKTFEDLLAIWSVTEVPVARGTPIHSKLKKYLRES